jgi:hypothetical protein
MCLDDIFRIFKLRRPNEHSYFIVFPDLGRLRETDLTKMCPKTYLGLFSFEKSKGSALCRKAFDSSNENNLGHVLAFRLHYWLYGLHVDFLYSFNYQPFIIYAISWHYKMSHAHVDVTYL